MTRVTACVLMSALCLAACGGDEGARADASVAGDAAVVADATPDSGPPDGAPGGCALTISPQTLDFGLVSLGTSSQRGNFRVQNTCTGRSNILSASLTGSPEYTIQSNSCVGAVPTGSSCDVVVVLTPTSTGSKSATLSVSGTPGGTVQATMTGTSIPGGDGFVISPSQNDFGSVTVGQMSALVTFTIMNGGGASTGGLTTTITGVDFASFMIASNSCAAPLAPGASCTIMVRFAPTSPGARTATLAVSATPGGTLSALLRGSGAP